MSDDRRARLVLLRDQLAESIAQASMSGAGTLAQLAAQYRATLADLDALEEPAADAPVSKMDELRRRRENRITTPAPVAPARSAGGKSGA